MEANSELGQMQTGGNPGEGETKRLPKPAKITRGDWLKIEQHLKSELQSRKTSEFRQRAEQIWKEVDRQVAMQAMVRLNRDGSQAASDWHSVLELGELSKSSENTASDVRRIIFPPTRFWFEPHTDLSEKFGLDPKTGAQVKNTRAQEQVDGRLRAFMMQQHADFGLKDRVELSVKEALHHGSFVAEIVWDEQEMVFEGTKTKTISAPAWKPHSMWNCYPDPSPSVIGTNMFYTGSMFIESYMPRHKAEEMVKSSKDDGWMPSQWKKVSKDEHRSKDGLVTKDVKLTTFWGDIVIPRPDEDLFYPNHKAILMNGTIVFMAPNATPYKPLIMRGYERMDVRDPYYMSPIIKQSPTQKITSTLANKYLDGLDLVLEPPIVYDGNDPDFVLNGGPVVSPGAKVSSKGSNAFQQIEIGDPNAALQGLELFLSEMKEKLGRPGRPVGDRATKAEVVKSAQDQEVSLVGFIDKMEIALRSYLYMQHSMNLANLDEYTFYSAEIDDPDFIRIQKKDLPKSVHFEVVGARGVLGEEERSHKMAVAVAFLSQNPLFATLLDAEAVSLTMLGDAGVKNPEHLLKDAKKVNPRELMAKVQQLTQMLQQAGQELQKEKSGNEVKLKKIASDHDLKTKKMQVEHADKVMKIRTDAMLEVQKLSADIKKNVRELNMELAKELRAEMADRQSYVIADQNGKVAAQASDAMKASTNIVKEAKQAIADLKAEVNEKIGSLYEEIKDVKTEVNRKRTKTVKGKKVNGEWQAVVTET
jgi:hypothetical protein